MRRGVALALAACVALEAGRAHGISSYDKAGNLIAETPDAPLAPSIVSHPLTRLGKVGGAASFSVIAAGSGPLSYQWQRNNTDIPSATGPTLFLQNLTVGDFATYKVIVTNGAGFGTSNEAELLLDSDEDGLPDAWEIAHFSNITAQSSGGDADGDGVTNHDEYQDGTLPGSAASKFFKLTLSGSVKAAPAQARYAPGTSVTITAGDQSGPEFIGWAGNLSRFPNPMTLVMDQDRSVTALRSPLPVDKTFKPTFTETSSGGDGLIVNAMILQPDGKVLVAGRFDAVNGTPRRLLARLNPDGTLDTTFIGPQFNSVHSQNGQFSGATLSALALQADGKILVGGGFRAVNGVVQSAITRLLPDGSVDNTFAPPTLLTGVDCIAVQPDGAILIGGSMEVGFALPIRRLIRLSSTGALDPQFTPDVTPGAVQVVRYQDGNIFIGGSFTQVNSVVRNRIAKLSSTGALDATFDPGTGFNDTVYSLLTMEDGGVLVGGAYWTFNGASVRPVVRLTSAGAKHPSFNLSVPGVPSLSVSGDVPSLFRQADGQILVGEIFIENNVSPFQVYCNGVARISSTGVVDTSFSPYTNYGSLHALQDAGGRVWLAGRFTAIDDAPQFNLAQLDSTGAILPSTAAMSLSRKGMVNFVTPYPEGSMLVGGSFRMVNGSARVYLARIRADGSLDESFNPAPNSSVACAALQRDGKIILGGGFSRVQEVTRNYLARVHANGSLDQGFTPPAAINASVAAIAVQPDGRIIVGGSFTSAAGPKYVARLEPNGALDTSFIAEANNSVGKVVLLSDGKILLAGSFTTVNGVPRRGSARLLPNGEIDPSYVSSEPASLTSISDIAQGPDFVALGGSFTYSASARTNFAVVGATGNLDVNRNAGGLFASGVNSVDVRRNGGVWAAGFFTAIDGRAAPNLAALSPRAEIDATLATVLESPYADTYGNLIYLQEVDELQNGDVIIGGNFTKVGEYGAIGLARYVPTNRVQTGLVAIQPQGPAFSQGMAIDLTVTPSSIAGPITHVEFETSVDGQNFTPLKDGVPISQDTWHANVLLTGAGTFYLRATATDSFGNQRTSHLTGPLQSETTPLINSAPLATGYIGQPFNYLATATRPPLTNFTASGLPAWATFTFQPPTNDALLSGTPNALGETLVSLTATNAEGSGQGSVKLQILETYDHWKTTQFSLAEQGDPRSAADADFDGDGLSNFQEFALRSLPKTPDLAGKPQVSILTVGQSQYLALTYRRYKWAGAAFSVQVTEDLQAWSSGSAHTTEVSRTDHGNGTETVVTRDNTPMSPGGRRFIRLRMQ
jgi:uncharacterized delta-60 repeat protein